MWQALGQVLVITQILPSFSHDSMLSKAFPFPIYLGLTVLSTANLNFVDLGLLTSFKIQASNIIDITHRFAILPSLQHLRIWSPSKSLTKKLSNIGSRVELQVKLLKNQPDIDLLVKTHNFWLFS